MGANLVTAAAEAALRLPETLRWCLIAGPNMPQQDYDRIGQAAGSNVELHRFREDFRSLLKSAELSVSQAGYNTVGDVLDAGCRSIVVPFTSGCETEQEVRAGRLLEIGLARSIHERDLSVEKLAEEIEMSLALPKPSSHGIDLDGGKRTAAILRPGGLVHAIRPSRSA